MNQSDAESQSDQDLADLIEQVVQQIQSGEGFDAAQYRRQHPELAAQIEQLIPTLELLGFRPVSNGGPAQAARHESVSNGDRSHHEPPFEQLDDFRIESEIGRGGMGVVYRARQITLDRLVALKVLPLVAMIHDRQLARFKIEAQAAASLNHPGIVPVYSVGCDAGIHYYAMQYIEGTSLAVILSQLTSRQDSVSAGKGDGQAIGRRSHASKVLFGPKHVLSKASESGRSAARPGSAVTNPSGLIQIDLSSQSTEYFRSVAELGIQAAEALEYAHQNGIIHRDIKPSNLLIDHGGKLWITDFGLARIEQDSELTMTGDLIGTLRYMSPEQANSPHASTDHRSDIYSLGATLYEMLTLRRAIDGDDRKEVLGMIEHCDPVAPVKWNPKIPEDLDTIILKALEKDPWSRYQSAQELADDLRCFLQDRTISAKRPSVSARFRKWTRRHTAIVNSVFIITVLLAIGSLISAALVRREQTQTVRALAEARRNFANSEANRKRAERANDRSATLVHVRGLGLAARSWRDGDSAAAFSLLRSIPKLAGQSTPRGFGWNYLSRSLSQRHETVCQSDDEILAATWSPDGTSYVTVTALGKIQVWEADGNALASTIEAHDGPVHSIAFHPQGHVLASVSEDGSLRMWEFPGGSLQGVVSDAHEGSGIYSVAFSNDGTWVVTAGADACARVWETSSLSPIHVLERHAGDVRAVAVGPRDEMIATASNDRTICLWNAASGDHQRTLTGHTGMVLCVAFSRSGRYVFSGSNDNSIRLWNTASGQCAAHVNGHHDGVQAIAVMPGDRRFVAADRSGQMRVWEISGKQEIDRFEEATVDGLHAVRISPDGRAWAGITVAGRLLVRDIGTRRTYEIQNGIANMYPMAYQQRVAFSPSGKHLYVADRILTRSGPGFASWEPIIKLDVPSGVPGSFSTDGTILATGAARKIRLFNAHDGTKLKEFESPESRVAGLRFSPDGDSLAAWFLDAWRIVVWNLKTWEIMEDYTLTDSCVVDLEYASDGVRFATCSRLGEVRVWDRNTGNSTVLRGIDGRAEAVAWVHEDQALAVGIPGQENRIIWLDGSGTVEKIGENRRIWDLDTENRENLILEHDYDFGVVVRDLGKVNVRSEASDVLQGHVDRVWSVAVDINGEEIISASRDGTVKRWSQPIDPWWWLTQGQHEDHQIDDMAWSSDATRLTVSHKFRCAVYEWPSGRVLANRRWSERRGTDPSGFAFEAVAADPRGRWVAAGHRDGSIRIFDNEMRETMVTLNDFATDSGVWDIDFSSDGRFLAASSHKENVIKVWRTDDWKEDWSRAADDCDDLEFSSDGGRLAYCDGRAVCVVETDTGREVLRLREHSITVHGVAFSPDGRRIATACEDRRLRIWDATTGKLVQSLSGHAESVRRVLFSADGRMLISGDTAGSIRLWHLETGQELYELARLSSEIDKLKLDPGGNMVIGITGDGRAHVFDGRPND